MRILLLLATACAWLPPRHPRLTRTRPFTAIAVDDPPFNDVRATAGRSSSRRSARLDTNRTFDVTENPKDTIQRNATAAIMEAFGDGDRRRALAVLNRLSTRLSRTRRAIPTRKTPRRCGMPMPNARDARAVHHGVYK